MLTQEQLQSLWRMTPPRLPFFPSWKEALLDMEEQFNIKGDNSLQQFIHHLPLWRGFKKELPLSPDLFTLAFTIYDPLQSDQERYDYLAGQIQRCQLKMKEPHQNPNFDYTFYTWLNHVFLDEDKVPNRLYQPKLIAPPSPQTAHVYAQVYDKYNMWVLPVLTLFHRDMMNPWYTKRMVPYTLEGRQRYQLWVRRNNYLQFVNVINWARTHARDIYDDWNFLPIGKIASIYKYYSQIFPNVLVSFPSVNLERYRMQLQHYYIDRKVIVHDKESQEAFYACEINGSLEVYRPQHFNTFFNLVCKSLKEPQYPHLCQYMPRVENYEKNVSPYDWLCQETIAPFYYDIADRYRSYNVVKFTSLSQCPGLRAQAIYTQQQQKRLYSTEIEKHFMKPIERLTKFPFITRINGKYHVVCPTCGWRILEESLPTHKCKEETLCIPPVQKGKIMVDGFIRLYRKDTHKSHALCIGCFKVTDNQYHLSECPKPRERYNFTMGGEGKIIPLRYHQDAFIVPYSIFVAAQPWRPQMIRSDDVNMNTFVFERDVYRNYWSTQEVPSYTFEMCASGIVYTSNHPIQENTFIGYYGGDIIPAKLYPTLIEREEKGVLITYNHALFPIQRWSPLSYARSAQLANCQVRAVEVVALSSKDKTKIRFGVFTTKKVDKRTEIVIKRVTY